MTTFMDFLHLVSFSRARSIDQSFVNSTKSREDQPLFLSDARFELNQLHEIYERPKKRFIISAKQLQID